MSLKVKLHDPALEMLPVALLEEGGLKSIHMVAKGEAAGGERFHDTSSDSPP